MRYLDLNSSELVIDMTNLKPKSLVNTPDSVKLAYESGFYAALSAVAELVNKNRACFYEVNNGVEE